MSEAPRVGRYMRTFTGKHFYPYDIRPGDICIEDIAHALSRIPRYCGHTPTPYTVAEHSLRVSQLCSKYPLEALLHDAAEAYTNDVPSPFKEAQPFFRLCEKDIEMAIGRELGLRDDWWKLPEVKEADMQALEEELKVVWEPRHNEDPDWVKFLFIRKYRMLVP